MNPTPSGPQRFAGPGPGAVEGDRHAATVGEAGAEHGDGRGVPERGGNAGHGYESDQRPVPVREAGQHHAGGGGEQRPGEQDVPVVAETVGDVADEEVGRAARELPDGHEHRHAERRQRVLLLDEREEHGERRDVPVLKAVADRDGGEVAGAPRAKRSLWNGSVAGGHSRELLLRDDGPAGPVVNGSDLGRGTPSSPVDTRFREYDGGCPQRWTGRAVGNCSDWGRNTPTPVDTRFRGYDGGCPHR